MLVIATSAVLICTNTAGVLLPERDRRYELAYNVGVQRLHSGQPVEALQSFLKALPVCRN
jgi:hypothetical protein